jgi:hypothetical protein
LGEFNVLLDFNEIDRAFCLAEFLREHGGEERFSNAPLIIADEDKQEFGEIHHRGTVARRASKLR